MNKELVNLLHFTLFQPTIFDITRLKQIRSFF